MDHQFAYVVGSAAAKGAQTGDVVRELRVRNVQAGETITVVDQLSLDELSNFLSKWSGQSDTTISLGVERLDEGVDHGTSNTMTDVVEYVKMYTKKIFAAGHCWSFDEALNPS